MLSTIDKTALRFRLKTDGWTDVLISDTEQIQIGQWYHISATYYGVKMRIYKNGLEIASREKLGNIDINPAVLTALGNQPTNAGDRPYDGFIDDVRIYNHALNTSEIQNIMNIALYNIYIDDCFASDNHCDVGTNQTIGFHAIYNINSSDVKKGTIYVNNENYLVNSSGWVVYNYSLSKVGHVTFAVTGVNIGDYSKYSQIVPNITVIWDRIKIIESGASNTEISVGESASLWLKAEYEYSSIPFNSSFGTIYVNGSECTWSDTHNHWEINITKTNKKIDKYEVSGIIDNIYELITINDENEHVILYTKKLNFNILSIISILLFAVITLFYYCARGKDYARSPNTTA